MSFDVRVYDETMTPLSSGFIELIETDHWGGKIDIQRSASLGSGLYGATLRAPTPAEPINLFVDDTSSTYAPTTLGHLNGKLPATLDVSLYPLPTGPGGTTGRPYASNEAEMPKTATDIAEYIHRQVEAGKWSDAQGVGVGNLVETVTRALICRKWSTDQNRRLNRWCDILIPLGISISAIRRRVYQNELMAG
jgi:hypothetical protein